MLPVLTASNAVAAGTTMRTTPLVPIGTTTTPTTGTTILTCVWLCPRIDVLVNSWTRVLVGSACQNVAIAWNHRPPWQVQKLTSLSIFEREFLLTQKRRYCIEPPPSVAVCSETEPAKCVGVIK